MMIGALNVAPQQISAGNLKINIHHTDDDRHVAFVYLADFGTSIYTDSPELLDRMSEVFADAAMQLRAAAAAGQAGDEAAG